MNTPTFKLTSKTTATAYHLRPDTENGWGGWAICTINDHSYELTVQSDWGNWAYRWSGAGMPERDGRRMTLTEFIADRTDCNYLADKLWGKGYGGREFDAHATVKAMRSTLAKRRLEQGREHMELGLSHDGGPPRDAELRRYYAGRGVTGDEPLTEGIAREIWDALGGDIADCRSGDHFIERFFQIDGYAWITEEPWEHLESEQASAYTVLLKSILPALAEACSTRTRQTIAQRNEQVWQGHGA